MVNIILSQTLSKPFMDKNAEQPEEIKLWYREDVYIYVLGSGDMSFRRHIYVFEAISNLE